MHCMKCPIHILIFIDFKYFTFIDSEGYMGRYIDLRFEDMALKNE